MANAVSMDGRIVRWISFEAKDLHTIDDQKVGVLVSANVIAYDTHDLGDLKIGVLDKMNLAEDATSPAL